MSWSGLRAGATGSASACGSSAPSRPCRGRLAEQHGNGGGKPPWPAFTEVSVHGLALALGCPAERVDNYPALVERLDAVVPTLGDRREPLVLEVAVEPERTFQP